MSYRALGRFACDGCKLIESGEVELLSDMLGPVPPPPWLRVETVQLHGELELRAVTHYCPGCAPLVQNYLAGRRMRTDGGHA